MKNSIPWCISINFALAVVALKNMLQKMMEKENEWKKIDNYMDSLRSRYSRI